MKDETIKQMTAEEYVTNGGLHCPYCGNDDCEGAGITVDTGNAYQDIVCNTCGMEWTDNYELVGYTGE